MESWFPCGALDSAGSGSTVFVLSLRIWEGTQGQLCTGGTAPDWGSVCTEPDMRTLEQYLISFPRKGSTALLYIGASQPYNFPKQ